MSKPLSKEERAAILDAWGANVADADKLINDAKSLARYEATVSDLEQRLAVVERAHLLVCEALSRIGAGKEGE